MSVHQLSLILLLMASMLVVYIETESDVERGARLTGGTTNMDGIVAVYTRESRQLTSTTNVTQPTSGAFPSDSARQKATVWPKTDVRNKGGVIAFAAGSFVLILYIGLVFGGFGKKKVHVDPDWSHNAQTEQTASPMRIPSATVVEVTTQQHDIKR